MPKKYNKTAIKKQLYGISLQNVVKTPDEKVQMYCCLFLSVGKNAWDVLLDRDGIISSQLLVLIFFYFLLLKYASPQTYTLAQPDTFALCPVNYLFLIIFYFLLLKYATPQTYTLAQSDTFALCPAYQLRHPFLFCVYLFVPIINLPVVRALLCRVRNPFGSCVRHINYRDFLLRPWTDKKTVKVRGSANVYVCAAWHVCTLPS